ncbi:MAG: hypothetical protein HN509_15320 [Halobacteriovoraceae bacterium]|jgi:GPI mannosyltransferase 3|nr:hypothetical protein [Halobacteriovoraceae bacterium]MBT5093173.1 hypothetical protein [Halobacteriovoraceae bacterium]
MQVQFSKRKILLPALILHLLCALFSLGFAHPDEHFQIIEFLNMKLGGISPDSLPWDFQEQIRSWSQPFLYYPFLKFFEFFNLTNPYFLSTTMRILSTLLGFFSLNFLAFTYLKEIRATQFQKCLLWMVNFLWFIPYIHARTSSENLSTSFFILGLTLVIYFRNEFSRKVPMEFCAGFLMGLAFLMRYQMGIPLFFLLLWPLFFDRDGFFRSLTIGLGVALALGLGVLIDFWGYGEWVFVPWNYLKVNLLEGKAAQFGVEPWWYYFKAILVKGVPPISLFLMLGTLVFWRRRWRHPITWVTLSFFVVHMVIGHKELRFLNFIFLLAPLMAADTLNFLFNENTFDKGITWITKNLLWFVNGVLLLFMSFKPAHTPLLIYSHLYHNYATGQIIYVLDEGSRPSLEFELKFYLQNGQRAIKIDFSEFQAQPRGYLLTSTYKQYLELLPSKQCHVDYSTYPQWLFAYNYGNWLERSSIWILWDCQGKN